jgi:hypothetical protein
VWVLAQGLGFPAADPLRKPVGMLPAAGRMGIDHQDELDAERPGDMRWALTR